MPDERVATVILLSAAITIVLFIRLGLYRAVIRFAGPQLLTTIFLGVCFSVICVSFLGFLFQANIPRSVPFIYFGMGIITIGGSRLIIRSVLTFEQLKGAQEKVIIYGAGSAGLQTATALGQGNEYLPVAFVDDDKKKHGTVQQGLRIYEPAQIRKIIKRYEAKIVLLAIANTTHQERASIIGYLTQFEILVKTIPGFADLVGGKARIEEFRNVEIEELLGRDTVPPINNLLDKCISQKSVLVTGAGGSIGSELCRQVIARHPKTLVLFEQSEIALYSIERELSEYGSSCKVIAMLGNVQNEEFLFSTLKYFG
ncbi:polysaccharide biosynthesis protein, partial [Pseudomonadales bacterium]|nr:polysaccharide biosynthesis protein [Pseudomonadales bacterium]